MSSKDILRQLNELAPDMTEASRRFQCQGNKNRNNRNETALKIDTRDDLKPRLS